MGINVLFLNESSLPSRFTDGTITGKELRIIQALPFVDKIYAVARDGSDWVGKDGLYIEPKIEVIGIKNLPAKGVSYFPRAFATARRVIRSRKIDVIQAESAIWSGPVALCLASMYRIPMLVEIRANYDRLVDYYYMKIPKGIKRVAVNLLRRLLYIKSTATIANSGFHCAEAIRFGAKVDAVFEVNPGISYDDNDVQLFKKDRENIFTIGYIGRLVKSKGVGYLLDTVNVLIKKKGMRDFIVLVVGEGHDRPRFQALADKLGIENYVRFVGMQPNFQWISKFDVLVNPTMETAALDMVNAEAYACGVPVVAFGKGGLPETVVDKFTGLIVEPGDIHGMAEAIFELYSNPALRKVLANNGTNYLKERYIFEEQVKNLSIAYKYVLDC